MKIDRQENFEYRLSSIAIDFRPYIDFSCFVLISAKNVTDNRQALFAIKGKEFKENLIVGAHFPLIKLLSLPCRLYFLTLQNGSIARLMSYLTSRQQ